MALDTGKDGAIIATDGRLFPTGIHRASTNTGNKLYVRSANMGLPGTGKVTILFTKKRQSD